MGPSLEIYGSDFGSDIKAESEKNPNYKYSSKPQLLSIILILVNINYCVNKDCFIKMCP